MLEFLESTIFILGASQAALRKQHIRVPSNEDYRHAHTWHARPLAKNWIATLGCWGAVVNPEDIAQLAGVNATAFRAFRSRYNVRTSRIDGRPGYRHQRVVALEAYNNWSARKETTTPVEVASSLGILPAELYIYVGLISRYLEREQLVGETDEIILKSLAQGWAPIEAMLSLVARPTLEIEYDQI